MFSKWSLEYPVDRVRVKVTSLWDELYYNYEILIVIQNYGFS